VLGSCGRTALDSGPSVLSRRSRRRGPKRAGRAVSLNDKWRALSTAALRSFAMSQVEIGKRQRIDLSEADDVYDDEGLDPDLVYVYDRTDYLASLSSSPGRRPSGRMSTGTRWPRCIAGLWPRAATRQRRTPPIAAITAGPSAMPRRARGFALADSSAYCADAGEESTRMKVQTYKPAGRDRWVFRLHGRDVPTPSHQLQRSGFATEEEAQREGRKIARSIDKGTFVVRHADSVGVFLAAWVDVKRRR
jgi:hypothetical protein